jgi:Fe2+ or Zn2+ uptake regulation protein
MIKVGKILTSSLQVYRATCHRCGSIWHVEQRELLEDQGWPSSNNFVICADCKNKINISSDDVLSEQESIAHHKQYTSGWDHEN